MLNYIDSISKEYRNFENKIYESEILTDEEKAMIFLAVTATMEDKDGFKSAIVNAKQEMISNEKIGYILAVISLLKSEKIFSLGNLDTPCCCSDSRNERCC